MFFSADEFEELGERQKKYEDDDRLDLKNPVIVRVDGRAFHTFTRKLVKPHDERMGRCMINTAKYLVEQFRPTLAYVQSDEITLAFCDGRLVPFSGRKQKLASLIASAASVFFNREVATHIPEKKDYLPVFDGRIFNVPNTDAVIENIFWRSCDAVRNSIFAAAFSQFSVQQLRKCSTAKQLEMLKRYCNIDWETHYPPHFQSGTLVTREARQVRLSEAELQKIPEKHRPTGDVVRHFTIEHEASLDPDERRYFIATLAASD